MKPFFLLLALAAILFCAAVVVSADDAERSERPRWGDDDQGRGGGDWDEDDDDDDDWGVRKAKTTTKKKCPCSTTTKKKCPCSTTTKKQCPCSTTTKKSCPCSSTTTTTSTTTACPPKKECDWAALKTCRADSSTKFDECVERKKCTFTACVADANEQFDKCLWGGSRTERWGDDDDDEYQERKAKCLKELAEDKEKCLFQRKASHAGCVAAKECRDAKCLLHIKDCEAPKPTTTTTSTTSPSVGSSCPATDFFGPAADFNVFIAGSDTLIYDLDLVNGDIEGRAAVNGGYRVKSFGTAQAYSCPDTADQAKKYNLIVNGKMDYSNGQLFCGSSLSLSSMNDPSLRQQSYGATNARVPSGKSIKDVSGLDFDSTTGYLQGVSNYFAQYAPGIHTHFRVSQVSPADLSKISIDAGNYVQIINIKGTGDINFTNFAISSQLDPSQVIFNVVGNNKVTISGFELNGHLLALQSDVVLENGHVTGNVYSKSLVGSGSGQVNLAPCP